MNPQDQRSQSPQSQPPNQGGADSGHRDATANMIRDQISRLFGDPTAGRTDGQPASTPTADQPAQPAQPPQVIERAKTLHEAEQMLNQRRQAAQAPARPIQPGARPFPAPARTDSAAPARPTQPAASPEPVAAAAAPTVVNTPAAQPESTPEPQTKVDQPAQQTNNSDNPYQQTQQNTATISSDEWRKYHSSWQQYYQKYYERYYVESMASQSASAPSSVIASGQASSSSQQPASDSLSKSQAIKELRSQIRSRVSTSAEKVRKSRHFIPIIAAACVLVLFVFLQYNRVFFATVEAYIAPGTVNPGDIIVDPNSTEALTSEPTLIIPKLNINVPAVYENTMGSTNQETHDLQMKAMEHGVAWFGIPGADAKPGQNGNVVLSGHSSNDVIDPGEYKFIFARLDKLNEGDTIYLTYDDVRYTYRITGSKVVKPTELDALQVGDDKPTLTLITCTPLGTSLNRLLVYADQISPDPGNASAANDFDPSGQDVEMPGNSPTIMQRIFGGGN